MLSQRRGSTLWGARRHISLIDLSCNAFKGQDGANIGAGPAAPLDVRAPVNDRGSDPDRVGEGGQLAVNVGTADVVHQLGRSLFGEVADFGGDQLRCPGQGGGRLGLAAAGIPGSIIGI